MKVKDLRSILIVLDAEDEVVLLNDAAPLNATNAILSTVIVQEPQKRFEQGHDKTVLSSRLVLTYNTRDKVER